MRFGVPDRCDRAAPCRVCGRQRYCCYWANGAALCTRVPSDYPARSGDSWIHKADGGRTVPRPQNLDREERRRMARRVGEMEASFTADHRARLADRLGVPFRAVCEMPGVGLGADADGTRFVSFPMVSRDHFAREWSWCGFSRRYPPSKAYPDGAKRTLGRCGLFVPSLGEATGGVLYVVEGASDVLAMLGAGLYAVGRPSNSAGAQDLAEFVRTWPSQAPWKAVVVVAENDEKPSGMCPGMSGACLVADRLRATINPPPGPCRVPVFVRTVPDGAKDPRAFFSSASHLPAAAAYFVERVTRGVGL